MFSERPERPAGARTRPADGRGPRANVEPRGGRPRGPERREDAGFAKGRPVRTRPEEPAGRPLRASTPRSERASERFRPPGRPPAGPSAYERAGAAGWGGVARRGAAGMRPVEERAAGPRRPARIDREVPKPARPSARYQVTATRRGASGEPENEPRPTRVRKRIPAPVAMELSAAGSPWEVARMERRLADATRSYEHDRYGEALPILRDLARSAPGVASIRELLGLTYYRLGRWREAVKELQAFAELTSSVEQHPVIADCERALGHLQAVSDAWTELRRAGAGSDVLAEGRLVMAGALADQGRLEEAIALLAKAVAGRSVRKPLDRHVRQWYALADLYERSGDLPEAREWFRRVVEADPELADAPERLASLR